MRIIDDNWIYEQSTTNVNRIPKYIKADELEQQMIKYGWKHPDSTVHEFVDDMPAAKIWCKDCIWHENWGEICYKHGYEDRDKEIVRCKDCKYNYLDPTIKRNVLKWIGFQILISSVLTEKGEKQNDEL